jgi:hypothetical protein
LFWMCSALQFRLLNPSTESAIGAELLQAARSP